ncbi:MAG: helix-turn-helix domain-containing protein [Nitrososphaerales archaeon]
MVSLHEAEDTIVYELQIPRNEVKLYLLLLNKGKMSKDKIVSELKKSQKDVEQALEALIEKGASIEIGSEYEALNPRFAITNMYRMMCLANKQEVKRNILVDQLATVLEKPYEDARTK